MLQSKYNAIYVIALDIPLLFSSTHFLVLSSCRTIAIVLDGIEMVLESALQHSFISFTTQENGPYRIIWSRKGTPNIVRYRSVRLDRVIGVKTPKF